MAWRKKRGRGGRKLKVDRELGIGRSLRLRHKRKTQNLHASKLKDAAPRASVPEGTVLQLVLSHDIQMRMSDLTPKQSLSVLCPLSYVRCRSWGGLFAAFGCPALRTTRRSEAFRG